MICPQCGSNVSDNDRHCPSCGKLLDEAQLQVKKIATAADGSPVEEAFDHED